MRLTIFLLVTALVAGPLGCGERASRPANQASQPSSQHLEQIRAYIDNGWQELRRSNAQLLQAAADPKMPRPAAGWPVYVSSQEDLAHVAADLQAQMSPTDFAQVTLRTLSPDHKVADDAHGILYLPHPYVVPGGRFNEMYGWDSYFIMVGLLRDGEIELARGMVDNFLYQVRHYGMILNANRTYYLTRSQPPFLTAMVRALFAHTQDKAWLAGTLDAIERYYAYWTATPHLTTATGLSRYHDLGAGPAPEVVVSERDASGRTHYDRVQAYYRSTPVSDYDLSQFYDAGADTLTPLFYVADRSMRESGFDPSNRFGPFNIGIIHYNPVCLNTLLYRMEEDTAAILTELGRSDDAGAWHERARVRAERINALMWDEPSGLYLDYDFTRAARRPYPFATTFYPLWAGIASPAQAARVVQNLPLFERAGGLQTSPNVSGSQWDAPFGWAPLQLMAVEGLRRYGYTEEAERIAVAFLGMVLKEFIEHRAILEKYDVVRRESSVDSGLVYGYTSNEIGFGWTNAAFTELYSQLDADAHKAIVAAALSAPAVQP